MAEQFNRKPVFMRKSERKTIRLSSEDCKKLGYLAIMNHCSEPEAIRLAISEYFDTLKKEENDAQAKKIG